MRQRGPHLDRRNSEATGFLALNRNDDEAVPVEALVSIASVLQTVRAFLQAAKRGRPRDGILAVALRRASVFHAYADFAFGAAALPNGGS